MFFGITIGNTSKYVPVLTAIVLVAKTAAGIPVFDPTYIPSVTTLKSVLTSAIISVSCMYVVADVKFCFGPLYTPFLAW